MLRLPALVGRAAALGVGRTTRTNTKGDALVAQDAPFCRPTPGPGLVRVPALHHAYGVNDATAKSLRSRTAWRGVGPFGRFDSYPLPPDGGRSRVILSSMTHRVGRKGQVVIPKAFREAVSLEPGDEVTFSREGNAIRVERVVSPDALMGRFTGHRLVETLEKDRRAERRR